MTKYRITIGFAALLLLGSCATLKTYERVNLNDPDMVLTQIKSDKFITTFHSYREAAAGASGGKSGGGCGCN
ncbi:MAG: DUF4266 domain-containing protein [Bacteroidales bacterium]|nr:DUF4266 domain-containing protein [Bacteroidales bacterium]